MDEPIVLLLPDLPAAAAFAAMSHQDEVASVIDRWVAGQLTEDWDLDVLAGPLRAVTHGMKELLASAAGDGVVRGARTQQFAITSMPTEEALAQATGPLVLGISLISHQEPATTLPGSVAAGDVPGLQPARPVVTIALEGQRTGLVVSRTPHGWRIVDIHESVRDEETRFSQMFCTHGVLQPSDPRAGLSFVSLFAFVRVEGASAVVAHTARVSNSRGDDVVLSFGEVHPGAQERGFLLPAHSMRVLQLPKGNALEMAGTMRIRTPSTSRWRRDAVEQHALRFFVPPGHPQPGWCA